MRLVAVETSCDETAAAILEIKKIKGSQLPGFKILSNVVASQIKLHKKYGGVYPSLAKREHNRNLFPVLLSAIKEGLGIEKLQIINYKQTPRPSIDAIAATIGPGLEPCLWVGVNFAKALAAAWKLPIIPVNHIEAHILVNFLNVGLTKSDITFPAVALVVSGGHTQLILMKKIGSYTILGETRDDAAGECFDKCARILGLGYPGGPAIAAASALAKLKIKNLKFKIKLPRPMIKSKDFDFSFSGLKTAVLYDWQKRPTKIRNSKSYKNAMAKEIQQAIIDVLINKTLRAVKTYKAETIILGGGVAANDQLRQQFKFKIKNLKLKINFLVPPKNLCTDNAVMIGTAAYFSKPQHWGKLAAKANLKIGD